MSDIQTIQSKTRCKKILLVDDEEGVLNATAEFFKNFFDDVDLAENGQTALEKITKTGPYDILITDLQMPVMNGIELIRATKSLYSEMFVVIISGNIEDEAKLSDLCHFYLTKPISFPSMIAMLKTFVEEKCS